MTGDAIPPRWPDALEYGEFRRAIDDGARVGELVCVEGRTYHVLTSAQFGRQEAARIFAIATAIRAVDADTRERGGERWLDRCLSGRRVMHLFAQPSTRTAESFIAAAEHLGAKTRLLNDLSTSSFSKGESVEDGIRTLASFFDAIVVRHADDEFVPRAAWALARGDRCVPVLSAGSGKLHHPTQSLLDAYTLEDHFHARGGIPGKRVLIVGDIARNRAARSLALLLAEHGIGAVAFACPQEHRPDDGLLAHLATHGVTVDSYPSIGEAVRATRHTLDALYVTRLQQEWDHGGVRPADGVALGANAAFVLSPGLAEDLGERCAILHPLPRINELPTTWDRHPGFLVWKQVRNGMWVRAGVLARIFGVDDRILERASSLPG